MPGKNLKGGLLTVGFIIAGEPKMFGEGSVKERME